jgi:hypothetical protein
MIWVLVVLTIAGGTLAPQPDLGTCTNRMLRLEISRIREAYCLSTGSDRVYYVHNGKVVGLE